MQKMSSFAKRTNSGDTQSAQNAQASNVGRRAHAASLKVPTKKTVLRYDDHVQQPPIRGPSGEQSQSINLQSQQRPQGHGHNTQQENDVYDTDAESLDTSVNQPSTIQVQDSQNPQQHGQDLIGVDDNEEFDEGENDDDQEGDDDEDGDGDGEFASADDHNQPYDQQYLEDVGVDPVLAANFVPQQRGLFDGNNSYPSTTSGPPSNFPQNYNNDQEPLLDDYDQQPVSPSPKPHRQLVQPLPQRAAPAPDINQTMHNKPQVFHRAAELRGIQNTVPNDMNRGGAHKQLHPTPLPTSQAVSHIIQPHPTNGSRHQNARTHANQLPHRGSRQPSGPMRFKVENLTQQAVPVNRASSVAAVDEPRTHSQSVQNGAAYQRAVGETFVQRQFIEEAPPQLEEVQEVHVYNQEPVEDYDRSDLFKMDYDQLKNEKFDHVPRAVNTVLSDDMLTKPLVDRLQHVRNSLSHEDQGKFFISLPAAEWEEAGDWFLDQFSDVIDRARKARQAKRKLAAGFEAEIEQRHEHVSKRQHLVHEVMSTMKVQGQGLMPKSPMRDTKSPSRQSKTHMRQK
jgi:hypothetical protein